MQFRLNRLCLFPNLLHLYLTAPPFVTGQDLSDILPRVDIAEAKQDKADVLAKRYFRDEAGKNWFQLKPLPPEAQFGMVQGITYEDYDGDDKKDLLLTGNFFPFQVQK
ncbi:MAG: hypothetical protein ABI863_02435 [Ginsengibacter sp.]